MLIFGPFRRHDWQKNNVAVNNSGQLVSQGEAPGHTGCHTAILCHFMDGHQSTVKPIQRTLLSKCFPFSVFFPERVGKGDGEWSRERH